MNTNFNPFYTPLGKIRPNGDSIIQYRTESNVQWVVKNYGEPDVKWYRQVANKWGIKEYSLNEREIESFKTAMGEKIIIEERQKQFFAQINKPLANVNFVDFPKALAFTMSMASLQQRVECPF